MRIVGFAQTMRLGSAAEEGYVLTIQLDNGKEASVPTSQETVLALTKLWAENRPSIRDLPRAVVHRTPAPEPEMPPPPMDVEQEDEGEVFGGDIPPAVATPVEADELGYPRPRESSMPRPKFLDVDDEDGNQV